MGELTIAKSAGFCFGVTRAVNMVYEAIEKENVPIYTYGPIIHNDEVVKDMEKNGVTVINDLDELSSHEKGVMIIRSHGISKAEYDRIKNCGFEVLNATCPFVSKIHRYVEDYSSKGYDIIIVGSPKHPEVCGIRGWADEKCHVTIINSPEDAEKYMKNSTKKLCIVSQTTFNYNKFQELVEIINKKTRNGYIECEIYVDIDEDREILDYYISFEIKDDGRIYITEERLSRKNGNYSKNSYLCVFESKDGALEKFGNDKVYEFVKEKTLNLLDKQSFASSILTMMNDFPPDKDLNNDFVTVIELFAFAISLNVCIDNADIHTNNRLYQKIQSIEENKKDSFTKETFNQLKREILEASGRDILVPKNLYSSYEEQIAKLSMFIQIFKPELVNIEVDKKDFDQFYKCNLKMIYENYTLDQEFESRGIKKMMDLFYYLEDACMGMITFIDELDSNINDVYLDKIIEYFILYGNSSKFHII